MKGQIKGQINKQTSKQNSSNPLKIRQYERADKRADKQMNKEKTTRTFEHSGEAWRVLAMQRYILFPNLPSLLLKNGVVLNFLLVFLSQIGKKLVPLALVIRCLLQGCF